MIYVGVCNIPWLFFSVREDEINKEKRIVFRRSLALEWVSNCSIFSRIMTHFDEVRQRERERETEKGKEKEKTSSGKEDTLALSLTLYTERKRKGMRHRNPIHAHTQEMCEI